MIIPKKLKAAGYVYDIICPHIFTETSSVFGRCDFSVNRIYITDRNERGEVCSDDHVAHVFLHELVHLCDHYYCSNNIGEEIEKEDLIDGIAQGLLQILKDNFKPLVPLKKRM